LVVALLFCSSLPAALDTALSWRRPAVTIQLSSFIWSCRYRPVWRWRVRGSATASGTSRLP
jgi:hypothetical protein